MIRRQRNNIFVVCIIGLFISSSIVPAFSIDFKDKIDDFVESKIDTFIEKRFNEPDLPSSQWYYDDEWERLYERHPNHHREYLMNHSEYPFDEHFDDYHEYLEYHEQLIEGYDDTAPYNLNTSSSERPDFENGTTWYVDDIPGEGPDNPPEDFIKIQDAIDSNLVKDGDTIFVHCGWYQEYIDIDKSIILHGENKEITIIDGNDNYNKNFTLNWAIGIVNISKEMVTIKNFTIQNGSLGIDIYSSFNEIFENNFLNCGWGIFISTYFLTGINIFNNNKIYRNIILNCSSGIYLGGSFNNIVTNNKILNFSIDGISLQNSSNNSIYKNNMNRKSTNTNFYYCISLGYSSKYNLIEKNIIYGEKYTTIQSNKYNTIGAGIALYGSSRNNIITKNMISNNRYGMNIFLNSTYNVVSFNNITKNFGDGISLQSAYNQINGNNIDYNFNGIRINTYNNTIFNNNINNNDLDGIGITRGSRYNIIQFNTCIENMKGIAVRESSDNLICDNLCEKNQQGISLEESDENNLTGNGCSENNCGIEIRNSYLNKINKCTISNNRFWGVYSFGSKFNFITSSDFIDNNETFKIVHYMGEQGDKNFFFRNYWSGRAIPLPIPYLIQINSELFESPFPHVRFTFSWDWFPKATPYDYDHLDETTIDNLVGSSFDSNGQHNRFALVEILTDRLSTLFSDLYDVLIHDHQHLLNRWRNGR